MKTTSELLTSNKFLPVIFFICVGMFATLVNINYLNRDGALYIFQAHYISQENYDWAEYLYKSTWYAYLIAILSKITSLSYLYSAKIINVLSLFTSAYYFLKISQKLLYKKNLEWPVILAILISIPIMDKYFPMIIRDHLFISFILIGIYFTLQYLDFREFKDFFILATVFIVSGFFRPEGWILFIITILFFLSVKIKLSKITLYFLFLFLIPIFLFVLLRLESLLPRFNEIWLHINNLDESYINIPDELMLFAPEYHKNTPFFNILSVLIISVKKWFFSFGLVSLIFFMIGLKKYVNNFQKKYLSTFVLVIFLSSIVIPVINFLSTHIMTSRYYLLSYWIANFFVVIGLYDFLYNKNQFLNRPTIKYVALALIIISLLNIFFDKTKENKLLDSVKQWSSTYDIEVNQCWIDDYRLRVQYNNFLLPPVNIGLYNDEFFSQYDCIVITHLDSYDFSNYYFKNFFSMTLIHKDNESIAFLFEKIK